MSIIARFSFPAGRYHATPWGRHVNEGAIEWPPSPWRLLRAFVACGFNRLAWSEVPPTAVALLEKLASRAPSYALPSTGSAHTRHFMPPFKGNTTLVIDTFAIVDREDAALLVRWDCDLLPVEKALLRELVEALPYLGRAESWVDGSLDDDATAQEWIEPGSRTSTETERVDLLAPLAPDALARWRADAVASATASRRQELEAAGKKFTPKEQKNLETSVPSSLIEVLRADTGALQKAGWSLPPGTKWVSYWRPASALNRPRTSKPKHARPPALTAVVYALSSETRSGSTLPPLRDAVRRCDAIHKALVRSTGPSQFAQRDDNHRHPSVFCLSLGTEGKATARPGSWPIDHVLVAAHRENPFDESAIESLRKLKRTFARGVPSLWLTPISEIEGPADFPALRASKTWVSHTPFVPPRHLKRAGKNSLAGQLALELEQRGIGTPESVEVRLDDGNWVPEPDFFGVWKSPSVSKRLDLRWRSFRRNRLGEESQPAGLMNQPALCIRLSFRVEVSGPIAAGACSHFGLGLFLPETAVAR